MIPIGTKVRIKTNLSDEHRTYSLGMNPDMISMGGEIVEIESCKSQRLSVGNLIPYTLKGSPWNWSDDMFDIVE